MAKGKQTKRKKGVSFESLDIDLKKDVDLKAGREAVKPTVKESPAAVNKAERVAAPKKSKPAKPETPKEELIRTTIDFPKSEHKKLKILAMDADMKLYQYLYNIIKTHMDNQK